MIDLDKFKQEINLIKKVEKTEEIKEIINLKDFNYINFTKSQDINDFLNEKSYLLLNFIGKSNIFLGNIFLEVHDYLNNNSEEEMTYIKWLEANNFNRMTALRYKKRAELYNSVIGEKAKGFIAVMNQKCIDELYKIENREEVIKKLENISNISEIEYYLETLNLIENSTNSEVEIIEVDNLNIENRVINISKSNILQNLEPKKQKQIDILLKKIEKIINE